MGILRTAGIGLCWLTLLVIVGGVVGGFLLYPQLDNEVQKHVVAELKKRYPQLEIQVGSARIVENRGITVTNIEFSVPSPTGSLYTDTPRKLLVIGELFIECPVTLASLYQKNIQIKRVVIKNPILGVTRSTEGTFPELALFSETGLVTGFDFFFPPSGKLPTVEVENGKLLYDDARLSAPPIMLSSINFTMTPEVVEQTRRIVLTGTTDSDFFRRLHFEAEFLPETEQWKMSAHCRQLDWTEDMGQYLPPLNNLLNHPPSGSLQTPPLFQGRFDFNAMACSDSSAASGYRFAVGGTLTHGRLDFPKIDRSISELSARFEVTSDKIVIDRLTGNSDSARFAASFFQEGIDFEGVDFDGIDFGNDTTTAELTLNVRDLRFDDELAKALSPFLNEKTEQLLNNFDYEGTTDLHAVFSRQNARWQPKNLSMQISDIGFTFLALPYQVNRLSGNAFIDESAMLRFHFNSKHDSPHKIVIDGLYTNIFTAPVGKVEIIGEDVPIDQKLIRSLPSEVQHVVNSLNPSGKINAKLLFSKPQGNSPLQKQFDISLDRVSVRYNLFPYPLSDMSGLLNYDGNVWTFRNVAGNNGTALVQGNGYLHPVENLYGSAPGGKAQEFVLHISAAELSVDDQISQAILDPEQRRLLENLNVNGKVNLNAQIQYRTDDKKLQLQFQAVPRAGLSIVPDRLPYKLENIAGEIRYEDGRVYAETLTGTHRHSRMRTGLDCQFNANGESILRLSPMAIDQLQADRELLDALPVQLRNFLEPMQITQPFNLSGGIEYRQTAQGEQHVRWDLNWILHQNGANLGLTVENVFGIIRLAGQSFQEQIQLQGELHLDSLTIAGCPVTSLRGPFSFDGKQLLLGKRENRQGVAPLQTHGTQTHETQIHVIPLTGTFCDGTIRVLGNVVWHNGISYNINADLLGASVEKVARLFEPTAQKISGTLNCINVHLHGRGTNRETAVGSGSIQLRNADIYGAPILVRLFRELRIKESAPDAGMFSTVDIDFRTMGQQMFFNSISFEGGAIWLHGGGTMRLDNRHVDLTMKTRLGNRRSQIPLISDLIGGVGDQLVQLRVTGPMSDPLVTRVAVPEVQKVLRDMQPEEEFIPPDNTRTSSPAAKIFPWNPF